MTVYAYICIHIPSTLRSFYTTRNDLELETYVWVVLDLTYRCMIIPVVSGIIFVMKI